MLDRLGRAGRAHPTCRTRRIFSRRVNLTCFLKVIGEQSRELAICQQLANGSKHFVLDKHNDGDVSSYRTASVSVYLSKNGESRAVATHGVFIEDGVRSYSDLGLFSRARDYWHDFFKRYGFE